MGSSVGNCTPSAPNRLIQVCMQLGTVCIGSPFFLWPGFSRSEFMYILEEQTYIDFSQLRQPSWKWKINFDYSALFSSLIFLRESYLQQLLSVTLCACVLRCKPAHEVIDGIAQKVHQHIHNPLSHKCILCVFIQIFQHELPWSVTWKPATASISQTPPAGSYTRWWSSAGRSNLGNASPSATYSCCKLFSSSNVICQSEIRADYRRPIVGRKESWAPCWFCFQILVRFSGDEFR